MDSRSLAFIVFMAALGNVLGFLTIAPTLVQQVALDFSLLPVFIAAFYGGPLLGGITGLLAGVVPSIWFGPLGSLGPLGVSVSIGKFIVGVAAGLLMRVLRARERSTWLLVPIVFLSFAPEALWIVLVFAVMVPALLPAAPEFLHGLWAPILIKGLFEIGVMAFFMAALVGHEGFKRFVAGYFQAPKMGPAQIRGEEK